MNKNAFIHLLFPVVALMFAVMTACSPSRPSGVLSEGDMEDILYDMHVAQAMCEGNITDANIIGLRAAVLKKHDVTQAEWDSSFNYYCRNADLLHDVYLRLSERVQNNVMALGGKVDGIQGEEADTANVWNSESSFVLMQQPPFNVVSYNIEPDSTFEDGDKMTLQFDVQYIFQDGYRDLVAFMAVYYENDSVATSVTHVSSDGHGLVAINNDVARKHVKAIKGYFMLAKNLSSESSDRNGTTLRLVAVRNVKLLHTHTTPPEKPKQNEKNDSIAKDSLRVDSLKYKIEKDNKR